jgi:hypothetical protein
VSNIEKNDLNRPEKARRIDKKSKFCFKLPRIDMENSVVGKNFRKSLKKSPKICLLNVKWGKKFKNMI